MSRIYRVFSVLKYYSRLTFLPLHTFPIEIFFVILNIIGAGGRDF
jgi:hypothetical protein